MEVVVDAECKIPTRSEALVTCYIPNMETEKEYDKSIYIYAVNKIYIYILHTRLDCYELTVMFITYVYSGNSVICTRMTSSLGIGRVSTAITAAQ